MRIIPRNARGLALCLALAGCSTQPEFEVDRTADFSSFDSFSVNSAEIPVNHQSLQGHVDSAIAAQLTSKGLKHTDAGAATVNVRYFLTLDDASTGDDEETEAPGELIVDVQDSLTGEVGEHKNPGGGIQKIRPPSSVRRVVAPYPVCRSRLPEPART